MNTRKYPLLLQNGLVNGLNGGIPTISNGAISTLPRYLNGGTHLARELGDIDEQVESASSFGFMVNPLRTTFFSVP